MWSGRLRFEGFHELDQADAQRGTEGLQFDNIDAAVAPFAFADKRLGGMQPLSELDLGQTRLFPKLA